MIVSECSVSLLRTKMLAPQNSKGAVSNAAMLQLEKTLVGLISEDHESTEVKSPPYQSIPKDLNIIQMGQEAIELSNKLHDHSKEMTASCFQRLKTGSPQNATLPLSHQR